MYGELIGNLTATSLWVRDCPLSMTLAKAIPLAGLQGQTSWSGIDALLEAQRLYTSDIIGTCSGNTLSMTSGRTARKRSSCGYT